MSTDVWDKVFEGVELAKDLVWKRTEDESFRYVKNALVKRFGSIEGLNTVELGSGLGKTSLGLALEGAKPTLLDSSPVALEGASKLFALFELAKPRIYNVNVIDMDCEVSNHLKGAFDVSMSFGLAEHFSGTDRRRVIDCHFEMVREGGICIISVPNYWCPTYQANVWIKKTLLKSWGFGLEIPFTRKELGRLIRSRSDDWSIQSTPLVESLYGHLLLPIATKIGLSIDRPRYPKLRMGVLDRFGYALIAVAER